MFYVKHMVAQSPASCSSAMCVSRRALMGLVAFLVAALLGFGCTGVANAGAHYETQVPDSSGTIERGYWHGAWKVTTTYSEVHIYSLQDTEYCEAAQNGHSNWKRTSSRQTCQVSDSGGKSVVGDYVKYGIEN